MNTLIPIALLAAPLLSQDEFANEPVVLPAGLSAERLSALSESLLLDEPGDGRTWARGATYKASFGPEGFTYRPFFGPDAAEDHPVRFDLTSVQVGGQSLELGPRVRSRVESTVALDRGSLAEVYRLSQRSVEQTFVLDALPVRGEVVLELAVETRLAARPAGPGFAFENALGAVHYGGATAIDADGRSLALEQTLEGGVLRISVPERFVQAAALPLVVDPILSTFSVDSGPRRQTAVDVAYDGNAATYQIVYSEIQSASDSDVLAAIYNASLDVLLPAQAVDITSVAWRSPANASALSPSRFLCAAVTGNAIGQRRVRGRVSEAATGDNASPQFDISGVGGETVDVGGKGNGSVSSFDFMVVWQEADGLNNDFDIVAQAVNDTGVLTGGRIVLDGDVGDLDRKPAISKSSGRPGTENFDNEYMVVWEREISSTNHDIRCQVMEYTGSLAGHDQFWGYRFSDALEPDVSTWSVVDGARRWAMVFERRTGADYDIFAVVAEDGSADNARSLTAMADIGPDLDLDQSDPSIAFDSQDYLVAYQTERAGGDRTVELTAFNIFVDDDEVRAGLALRRETVDTIPGTLSRFALASHWDGGGPFGVGEPGDACLVFTDRASGTTNDDVAGAIVSESSNRIAGNQYCEANVNSSGASAWIRATNNLVSVGFSTLVCENAPANQFGIFLVSQTDGFSANPGGSQGNLCLSGSIGRFNAPGQIVSSGSVGRMALTVDTSILPQPSGFASVMAGESWYYQAWMRDLGGTSNFSNGVRVHYR